MRISKAIEILKDFDELLPGVPFADHRDAIKLGIEALKSHQKALQGFRYPEQFLLPGETLEVNDEPT